LPVYQIPEAGRAARGKPIVNLLGLRPDEKIQGLLALRNLDQSDLYIVTFTRRGYVKRTLLSAYANIRSGGIIALALDEGDMLISVSLVRDADDLFIATRNGKAIRFAAREVRPMGRSARGVRGIALRGDDEVVSASAVREAPDILTVTANGYGKRTPVADYRPQGRGGLGLINLKVSPKTGPVVAALPVWDTDEIIVATRHGKVIRTPIEQDEQNRISRMGRATQGVKVIRLSEGDEVVSVTRSRVVDEDEAQDARQTGPEKPEELDR